MKKSWLLLTLFSCFLPLQAQFHTIAYGKPLYKVEEDAGQMEIKNLPESGEANNPVSHAEPGEKQEEAARNRWIERYLSVSYPLKRIEVTSYYGSRRDPFTGKKSRHKGLDLRARNEEVYAMMPGEVVKVSSDRRSGNYIVLRHGGYTVSYCHLSKVLVREGTKVKPGEAVAISGRTGRATGFHLHITVRNSKRYVNPLVLLEVIKEIKNQALENLCLVYR